MGGMTIRKAVIPVAGLGTRLRPLSAVVPKAMMPVPDRQGRVLPVLHHVLAEVAAAGVSEAIVVASPNHEAMLRAYFVAAAEASRKNARAAGKGAGRTKGGTLGSGLPRHVEIIVQEEPLGFGHAVWLGKEFVGRAPFLVMLGDHIQVGSAGQPACAAQVAQAFTRHGGAAMIGVQPVDAAELPRVGVAGGAPLSDGAAEAGERRAAGALRRVGGAARGQTVFRCTDFIEKPDLAAAREHLRTPGLPRDHFLAHCGIYAFSPEIFDCLEVLVDRRRKVAERQGPSEVQLADAQCILLLRHPNDYRLLQIAGRAFDTGTPAGYVATWKALLAASSAR
jgi:UTP--glucose-1-phosphate uridylyltransferase